ncbi:hypothetical protein [Ramlibacter humi]|nr:hypothetical protein [Ramlibacter humi]
MEDDLLEALAHFERAARLVLGTTATAALLGTLLARLFAAA